MQRDQFNQQYQKNDTFYRPSVVNAQCIIGSEKVTDGGIDCIFAIDRYSQSYGEINSCFRHSAKYNNLLQVAVSFYFILFFLKRKIYLKKIIPCN